MRVLTQEEFIERAKGTVGDNYDFTKTKYFSHQQKVIVTCKIHGDFLVTPANLLEHSSGCPFCAKEKKRKSLALTTQQFIKKAQNVHKDLYDYSLVDYYNRKTKVRIICKKHGIFEQTPCNHLKGCGCPHCRLAHSNNSK